jgi:hypothetical protein
MIGFSPRGTLDLVAVFPLMMVIALALDIIDLLLITTILGATIINILGALTIGLWVIVRSRGERSADKQIKEQPSPETQKEGKGAMAKEAGTGAKTEAKGAARAARKGLGRVLARVGIIVGLEFIPALNSIFFGWTIMVVWEFVSDLKNFSLEAGD